MRPEIIFYYDMDGVLCDWFGTAAKVWGRNPNQIKEYRANWPEGEFHSENILNLSTEEFWALLEEKGFEFWANLEEIEGARKIWDHSQTLGAKRRILSCPSIDPASLSGKSAWMKRFTGDKTFRDIHLTPLKYECAGFGRILIDDHDKNIEAFKEAGGMAICYPQPWNCMHKKQHEAVQYVLDEMTSMAMLLNKLEVDHA